MDSLLSAHVTGAFDVATPLKVNSPTDDPRAQVWALLAGMHPAGVERRRDQRYPFPRLFVLTPVDPDTLRRVGATVTAAGKHLSESGVSFFHPEPLPYRWVIATVETSDGHPTSFLVDLDWCRFTRQGWYESGGRFLRAVT
jgi:hypothetical protein